MIFMEDDISSSLLKLTALFIVVLLALTTVTAATITIDAKPSTGNNDLPYIWHTTTFINFCILCGANDTLVINPKGVPESELTCLICDADYDGTNGADKSGYGCRGYLIKIDDGFRVPSLFFNNFDYVTINA